MVVFHFPQGKQCILSMAERIACLQSECGLSTSVEEFKEQYHFGLVEAVFEWARGMPFSEITNLTDVQEGKIALFELTERRNKQRLGIQRPTNANCVRQSGERILFESFQISAGINLDAMRFPGLGAILLWLAHLDSISHETSLDIVQPSRNHPRRENTDRTHLPNL